ncbi:YIP1 family protein [Mesobacterium sp. TK19101]|uniref:YIP1 family protein n=1 Tax=Mesobacterium hydrothermale TaxID=3111907 RepID=A0ABU6HM36_9RHOB|nr:YIP1 family protein [Mesobacterium sp. TK19101]MEC3862974.1 YIP1 family protein [Mesobacterium sp. TK19101]
MTPAQFSDLVWRTLSAPRDMAEWLLSLRLSEAVLWPAFALVVVLDTLFFQLLVMQAPDQVLLVPALASPVLYLALSALWLSGMILLVTGIGRMFGGTAQAQDVAVLVIWLMGLDALVSGLQAALVAVAPGLVQVVAMIATFAGIWLSVVFISVAHRFTGPFVAMFVLLLSVLGAGLVLGLALGFLGVSNYGMLQDV